MASSQVVHIVFVCTVVAVLAGIVALAPRAASASQRAGIGGDAAQVHPTNSPLCVPSRPHASGTSVETISTPFGTRTYRLHVPTGYTGNSTVPLVLNWHGATSDAAFQESYTGFSTKADASGFIVVYPQGVTTMARPFNHFNAWQLGAPEPDDVAFTSQLLDTLQSQLCVDINRVFSTGYSNGSMMSVRLACSLSNRIAAIGGVAGAYYPPVANDLNASETCPDTKAVPLIEFHGTSDPIVPYNGGLGGFSGFMITFRLPQDDNTVAEDVLADWATHNGCTSGRQESQATTNVRLVQYTSCTDSAIAQLYAVDGGGHTWPDGTVDLSVLGTTTHEVSATDLMWSFFQAHPLGAVKSVGGIAELPNVPAAPAAAAGSSARGGTAAGEAGGIAAAVGITIVGVGVMLLRRRRA
jgi:polyhydroxybutyrate depolymerase